MVMRLVHVGLGVRGRHWLEIVRDDPGTITVAVVDPGAEALAAARRQLGADVRLFTELEAALAAVEADAALVASPSVWHAAHTLTALRHGLHVLVEKPLALTVKDAEELIAAADAVGRRVVVAENYRFFPAERTLGRWLRAGRLGRIATVTCTDLRAQPPEDLGRWAAALPYPQLIEIAVHHFDSIRYLTGHRPATVLARAFNPPGSPYAGSAATQAILAMEDGTAVSYLGSLCATRWEFALQVDGEAGTLWTDRKRVWWRARGARFFRPVRLEPAGPDGHRYPRAGTAALLDQLRAAVLHGLEGETSARDNVWTVAMIEAAVRSTEEGRAVAITDVGGLPAPLGDFPALDRLRSQPPA